MNTQKRTEITVDLVNNTLVVTKAFYKKACVFGSAEYYALKNARSENPDFVVTIKAPAQKKSYNGLSFKRMEDYIKTQPNSEQRLGEFEQIKLIAEAKGAKYPLSKKWFLDAYPEYKESTIELGSSEEAASSKAQISELGEASGF